MAAPPETLHKRLLDNLTTGVMVFDQELRLRYINLAAESLLEISGRQFGNCAISQIFVDADKDIEAIINALAREHSFTKRKTELRVAHGKKLLVDYTITPFPESGELRGLMEIQAMSYADRISREENLIATHETTRELVRGLAHEIKNPLGGIRGAAQLLASELPDASLADYTSVIIEEADRLHKLVDQLMGSRKLPEVTSLNIHQVLERVRNLIEAEVGNRRIEVHRNYDPSIPSVSGDFELLIQAVLNIVRNAVQALDSPNVNHGDGRIELKTRVLRNITIGSRHHRLTVRVDIIDNGPGIPEDMRETIFYPMISGRPEGSGLGLSIAHSVIHQHHGIIECNSRPDRTCFSIYLPIQDEDNGES